MRGDISTSSILRDDSDSEVPRRRRKYARRPHEHLPRAITAATTATESTCETRGVGFDPTRKHKRTRFDYVYVAASVIVFVALIVWALA